MNWSRLFHDVSAVQTYFIHYTWIIFCFNEQHSFAPEMMNLIANHKLWKTAKYFIAVPLWFFHFNSIFFSVSFPFLLTALNLDIFFVHHILFAYIFFNKHFHSVKFLWFAYFFLFVFNSVTLAIAGQREEIKFMLLLFLTPARQM